MKEFTIVIKQITNYGTFRDNITISLLDVKSVLPKKIRDKMTEVGALHEIEKVTISIEEVL